MYKKYCTDIFDEKTNNKSYTKEFKKKVIKNVTSKKSGNAHQIDSTTFCKKHL